MTFFITSISSIVWVIYFITFGFVELVVEFALTLEFGLVVFEFAGLAGFVFVFVEVEVAEWERRGS